MESPGKVCAVSGTLRLPGEIADVMHEIVDVDSLATLGRNCCACHDSALGAVTAVAYLFSSHLALSSRPGEIGARAGA